LKVAIYSRIIGNEPDPVIEKLLEALEKDNIETVINQNYFDFLKPHLKNKKEYKTYNNHSQIKDKVDFIFSVGGDGTLLDTLEFVRDSEIPILGINTGRLGFLSGVAKDNICFAIESLIKGHYSLDKRALLRLETNNDLFGEVNYGLNDLTIHKMETSSMINIHTYLNGEYLNTYWADGIIIATPTGSTGYSLSCGGPIMMPQSENFVITPIAPHNLNVRPIVVSDKSVITLEIEGRSQYFMASLDSRSEKFESTIQLAIRKETFYVNLVRMANDNFLKTIREKLMWGKDSRN
jgi:NAD+ kinase